MHSMRSIPCSWAFGVALCQLIGLRRSVPACVLTCLLLSPRPRHWSWDCNVDVAVLYPFGGMSCSHFEVVQGVWACNVVLACLNPFGGLLRGWVAPAASWFALAGLPGSDLICLRSVVLCGVIRGGAWLRRMRKVVCSVFAHVPCHRPPGLLLHTCKHCTKTCTMSLCRQFQ